MPLEAYRDGVFSTATPRYGFETDALEAFRDGALGAAVSHFGPTSPSWGAAKMRADLARGARISGLGAATSYWGPSFGHRRTSLLPRMTRIDGLGWFGADPTAPTPAEVKFEAPGVSVAAGVGGFIGGAVLGVIGTWMVMRRRS